MSSFAFKRCAAALAAVSIVPGAAQSSMKPEKDYERTKQHVVRPPQGRETRLAIAMGGAVSLGAFEAGILAELTSGLANHNAEHPQQRYVIDVMAGASAGSMSLAVLARELYNPSADVTAPGYAMQSVFHKAWVEDIGIAGLINDRRLLPLANDPYIFDAGSIYAIANSALGCRLQQDEDSRSWKPVPAPGMCGKKALTLAPENLALGMTLSNLDGLTRTIHFEGADSRQTFYDDRRMFLLSNRGRNVSFLRDPATQASWNDVALTAIASGAFPFAFEPVALERHGVEFEYLPDDFNGPSDTRVFHYVDGGFFDNDPVHLAQKLARLIDAKQPAASPMDAAAAPVHQEGPEQEDTRSEFYELLRGDRRFIYLSPHVPVMRTGRKDSLLAAELATSPVERLMPYAQRIVSMGMRTAGGQGFREYIRELDTNQSAVRALVLEMRELERDTELAHDMLRALAFMQRSQVKSGDILLLRKFVEFARPTIRKEMVQPDHDLDDNVERRLDFIFQSQLDTTAAAWLRDASSWEHRQLFVRLYDARELLITNHFILITATDAEPVAGGAFGHFGGFFNRQLREFDFFLGRYYAQQTLMNDFGVTLRDTIQVAEIDRQREPLKSIESLASHFASLDDRIAFRKQAEKRLGGYVQHARLPRASRPWAYSAGNRFLDTKIYHQPRGFLVRGFVGNDEFRSVAAGAALDPFTVGSWILGKEKHKRYYDDIFRKNQRIRSQLFVTGEYGYWHPTSREVLDWGGMLQLHWRLNGWVAPRPTFEAGGRMFVQGGSTGWYHNVGLEVGSIHIGVKTDRGLTFKGRPRHLFRAGLSFRPMTAWRSLRTLWQSAPSPDPSHVAKVDENRP